MEWKNNGLCKFCFERVAPGERCRSCGLTDENYNAPTVVLKPGTKLIGKYIIGRFLGMGGFGITYLAYSPSRNKKVAIKEYYPNPIAYRASDGSRVGVISEDKRAAFQKGANRFFDEAKTVARFNGCDNIISVYEFFQANDTVYYSMEYLEGVNLKKYAEKRGGTISEAEAVKIMREVAKALVTVHSTSTLHRDISPDNIFVCQNGDVRLIDFGASKQVLSEESQNMSVILKQGFAPPEQYQRNGKQNTWTDIYSLGATIYYAMTGKTPPNAADRQNMEDISMPGNISAGFGEVLNKCMKMRIEDRYHTAVELLNALKNFGDSSVGGYPPSASGGVGYYPPFPPVSGSQFVSQTPEKEKKDPKYIAMIMIIVTAALIAIIIFAFIAVKLSIFKNYGSEAAMFLPNTVLEQLVTGGAALL